MQVRHERPMSELSYQVSAPLKLTLEAGQIVTINHWSLDRIDYPEAVDILPKSGLLSIPFQGVDIQFFVEFETDTQDTYLKFKNLTGRQRETLAIFYRSILSGKMVSTGDMITSLDTPVDLVPMGETDDEKASDTARASPQFMRVIWNVAFYLILSVVVFGLIGQQIWTRISQVSLMHARVVAPLVEHRNADAAYVDEILVAIGDEVQRGQTLIRLNLPEHDAKLTDIRGRISAAETRLQTLENTRQVHLNTGDPTRRVLLQTYNQTVASLNDRNFFSGWDLDDVIKAWHDLRDFDDLARLAKGPFYDILRGLDVEIQAQNDALGRLKRELGNHKDAMDAVDIVATTAGTVQQIDVFEDQYIARGMLAITIEENRPRMVRAWLSEEMSQTVHIGMQSRIRFSEAGKTRSITGTISDIQASIDPDISDDFGIIVSVVFNDMNVTQTRHTFRTNAPVTLSASKDWAYFWSLIGLER